MTDEQLNLTLADRRGRPSPSSRAIVILLVCLLLVGVANFIVSLLAPKGEAGGHHSALTPEAEKELSLKLESQGLKDVAASAWREYLENGHVGSEEAAKIWYRIGKLHQESGEPERALEAYYRSEKVAPVPAIESDLNRRIEECLEAAGKFSALRYELSERVGAGKGKEDAGSEVLAEIGPVKITKAALDRRIEEQIERQLSPLSSFMDPDELRSQKEAMLKRLSSPQERSRALNQMILEEILYRKAREDKLLDSPDVRARVQDAERAILAQQVLEQEVGDQVKITPGDVRTYYDANKKDFVEPAKARISYILLKDKPEAEALLATLKDPSAFAAAAKAHSLDEATKGKGGAVDGWVHKGQPIPAMPGSPDADEIIFNTPAGTIADKVAESDKGFCIILVREREPERQRPFEEVRSEAYQALFSRKAAEVQDALLSRLKERYNVVIHGASLGQGSAEGRQGSL